MGFDVALSNVILTLIFIIPGYLLCKAGKVKGEHLSTMSAVLVYILGPAMVLNSFLSLEFSWHSFAMMGLFALVSFFVQAAFMLILYLIFRKKYENSRYRLLTIGSVLGNVGFFGLPIIKALIPDQPIVMCYSSIYVLTMNLLVFTMGVYCLTNDRKYISWKPLVLNPTSITLVVALPLYIFGVKQYLPDLLTNAVSLLGAMTTPVCMIILGIRLGTMSMKKVFTNWFAYIIIACKMLVFPLFAYFCVYFFPLDITFKASILILSGTPCASVILNLAEIHHSEEKMSANCVLLSTLLCFLTIPLLTLLVR